MDELASRNYVLFDLLHAVLPTELPLEECYSEMSRLYDETRMTLRDLLARVRNGRIPRSSLPRMGAMLESVTKPEAYLEGHLAG